MGMEKELPAFRQRRELMEVLRSQSDPMYDRSIFLNPYKTSDDDAQLLNSLMPALKTLLPTTDVVIWRSDLFNAAIYGHDAFMTDPVEPHVLPSQGQWWSIDGNAHDFEFGKLLTNISHNENFAALNLPHMSLQNVVLGPIFRGSQIGNITSMNSDVCYLVVYYIMRERGSKPNKLPWIFMSICSNETLLSMVCAPAVAALTFMQQQFVTTRKAHTGKRLRLPGGITHQSSYDIVVLRRKSMHDPRGEMPESEREYHHSWGVKGHWRKLHQPRARDGSKFTFIESYIKGDPDKPFLPPKETIIRVKR